MQASPVECLWVIVTGQKVKHDWLACVIRCEVYLIKNGLFFCRCSSSLSVFVLFRISAGICRVQSWHECRGVLLKKLWRTFCALVQNRWSMKCRCAVSIIAILTASNVIIGILATSFSMRCYTVMLFLEREYREINVPVQGSVFCHNVYVYMTWPDQWMCHVFPTYIHTEQFSTTDQCIKVHLWLCCPSRFGTC